MNAYLAELIATERMAEFQREVQHARLVRDVRRRPGAERVTLAGPKTTSVIAAAAITVALWLRVGA